MTGVLLEVLGMKKVMNLFKDDSRGRLLHAMDQPEE
jgi:hypothetical protein